MADNATNIIQDTKLDEPPFWQAPFEFLIHALTGIAIFAVVAAVAVVLNLAVVRLREIGVSIEVIYGLKFAEFSIFSVDLYMLAVFLVKTAKRVSKKL